MEQISFIECFKAPFDIIALYIVLIFNLALTLVHFVKELKGFQWRYLGAIAGLQIPDKLGIISFFVLPLGFVGGLGLVGIAPLNHFVKFVLEVLGPAEILHFKDLVTPGAATACVAAVIGSRLSDSIFIHIRPHRQGYCPNPALGTIPLYLAEAAWLTVLFFPGFWNHYIYAAVGFIGGFAFFFTVLPGLKVVRTFRHVEPWHAGESIPPWVQGHDVEEVRSV